MGHPERADGLHRLRGRLQRIRDDSRGEGEADPLAEPPGDRPRVALRQGALHVPAPPRARPDHGAAPARPEGLREVSWDDALDAAEELLREAGAAIVTALSGSETTEIAYALGRVLREGLGAHSAVLPEATSDALEAFRLPLSAIAEAELVVVVGDDPSSSGRRSSTSGSRRRRGAARRSSTARPERRRADRARRRAALCAELADPGHKLGERLRKAERAVLVWSGPAAEAAPASPSSRTSSGSRRSRLRRVPSPSTPERARGRRRLVRRRRRRGGKPEPIGLLVVSGDEAAADPACARSPRRPSASS